MNRERTLKPASPSGTGKEGFLRTERGIIIFVALLVMALLALLGATFLTMSSTESSIARNEVNMARAFNIAEAGLERAKARIKDLTATSLNDFLPGGTPGPDLGFGTVAFDDGTYTVLIEDDADAGGNPNLDTNNRVFIRSTGKYNNGTVQKEIRALVEVGLGAPVPAPKGAGEVLLGAGGTYEMHAEGGGGSFDGRDWTAPADIGGCGNNPIPDCGTKISDTGTVGAFANSGGESFALANGGTMYGTGCIVLGCATTVATASNEIDNTVPLNRWDNFIDKAIPRANQTLVGTVLDSPGTYTWGTAANPQITVINNLANVNWKATVNGAGVLIIDSPGPAGSSQNLVFGNGELNWQGLVIIRSPGTVQFEIAGGNSGAIRVFGQIVNRSATRGEIELHQGNSFVKYSSVAMGKVRDTMTSNLTVRNWQEVALQ